MRRLDPIEEHALSVLRKHGSYCPGLHVHEPLLMRVLDRLVKKHVATVEMTDDGPKFTAVADA